MSNRRLNLLKFGIPLGMIVLLGLALLLGFFPKAPSVHINTRLLMGTLVTISISDLSRNKADQATQQAFAEIKRIEEAISSHQPSSEVSMVNQVPRETWSPISGELGQLLQRGLLITTLSKGAFSMGLEPLTRLWGFSTDSMPKNPPPSATLMDWLNEYPNSGAIELQAPRIGAMQLQEGNEESLKVRLKNRSVGLDLGGIAKGYAIDRAITVLRQAGVQNAVVDAGGDLRIIGSKASKPWRIGIQNPRQHDEVIALCLLRGNMAMVTTGDYERYFLYEGKRFHHILNPQTASSANAGLSSVTVQATDAMTADGLSTAIFVLGAEKGLTMLSYFPGSEALLITEEGKAIRSRGFVGETQ